MRGMGKHLHDESDSYKQSGCMWGIVHVLNYHQWQSSVKKIIPHRKYHGRSPLHFAGEWSPDTSVDSRDGYEKLIDQEKSPRHGSKKSRSAKKRSLRARFKAMIFEETSMDDNGHAKSSLQRTYSIHHLESVDDLFGKIRKDWTHPIIFLPRNSEDYSDAPQSKKATIKEECDSHSPTDSKVRADIFDIFKVDKEVFLKNLQDSDEGIANFSRSAFGSKTKGKFSKSRSFPVGELGDGRKLKPLKIESKQKEVWRFPGTFLSAEPKKTADRLSSENLDYREEDSAVDRTDDDSSRKRTHRRSSSLNESMDKYARLFENSLGKDVKLSSSKSLKLTTEYGYAPPKFKRIRSLSNSDSYYSSINFEVSGENPPGTSLVVIEEDSSSGVHNSEEEATLPLNADMETREGDESLSLEESDGEFKNDESLEEIQEQFFVSDSEILLKNVESLEAEIQLPKGKHQESRIHNLEVLENHEIKERISYPQKKSSDLDYVRHLLERSEITLDASEMTWHASDQLLSPQLFEEIEGGWPHEEDELDGYPDFRGCWHHQMLFDAVNEVLLEVYDISLPYYPKALSSNCHVPPFPTGSHIIEEVCSSIGSLMNVAPEERQLLDSIVGRDLGRDRGWMNLQLESESVALYLEELIFDELVEEVMVS